MIVLRWEWSLERMLLVSTTSVVVIFGNEDHVTSTSLNKFLKH